MKNLSDVLVATAVICGIGLFAWFMVACTVFKFRHPWATSTEELIYLKSAMEFRTVPYSEMRPRD